MAPEDSRPGRDRLRVAVLGAGAMGCLFGARLAVAGHDVRLLDVNADRIAAVGDGGLILADAAGERTVEVAIGRPEAAAEPVDFLVVFTKTIHADAALGAASGCIGAGTVLLSLQNGLGNAERLVGYVPGERAIVGVTTLPSDLVAANRVESHGEGQITIGAAAGDGSVARRLAATLSAADLPCAAVPDVQAAIWQKVAFNAALNSLAALGRARVGRIGADTPARSVAKAILDEVLAVARASGVDVDPPAAHAAVAHALSHHARHKPSMLQDVEGGRPTERPAIIGEVVDRAVRMGIAVPHLATVDAALRLLDGPAD